MLEALWGSDETATSNETVEGIACMATSASVEEDDVSNETEGLAPACDP